MIAFVLGVLLSLLGMGHSANVDVIVIPPMPSYAPTKADADDDLEWFMYRVEAERDYAIEFTALFDSYETKVSKNGRTMIRVGNSGSFKFVKKG